MTYNQEHCLARLEQIRWGRKPKCPYCQSTHSRKLKNERRYQCNECFTSYSVTVGTLFHKTHVGLEKWFLAIHLVLNSLGGISVRQLAQKIGVNKNTASYMIARIRKAMTQDRELLQQIVEIDSE
ncbi:MAG TPA: transposase [Cyanobacteria bacterium UBA11162]|nr:transposase [Cyanobacteria bacterium UBA11162]